MLSLRFLYWDDQVAFCFSYPKLNDKPTVKDASEFQKNQKDSKGDEIGVFINFISTLGMPKEVAENLGLSKIKTLTDAIMGDLEKK